MRRARAARLLVFVYGHRKTHNSLPSCVLPAVQQCLLVSGAAWIHTAVGAYDHSLADGHSSYIWTHADRDIFIYISAERQGRLLVKSRVLVLSAESGPINTSAGGGVKVADALTRFHSTPVCST